MQLPARGTESLEPGAHDDIDCRKAVLMQSEGFTDNPADAIALYGSPSDAQRDGKTQTRSGLVVADHCHREESVAKTPAARVHGVELRLMSQAPGRRKGQPLSGRAGHAGHGRSVTVERGRLPHESAGPSHPTDRNRTPFC